MVTGPMLVAMIITPELPRQDWSAITAGSVCEKTSGDNFATSPAFDAASPLLHAAMTAKALVSLSTLP